MEKIKWRYIKMRYIYNVRKDILKIDEENHTVYGIDVIHNSAVVNRACRGGNFRQPRKKLSLYRYVRITGLQTRAGKHMILKR